MYWIASNIVMCCNTDATPRSVLLDLNQIECDRPPRVKATINFFMTKRGCFVDHDTLW